MKRRSFISLAGLAAALRLPWIGRAAPSNILAGSAASVSDGTLRNKRDRRVIIKVVGVGGAGMNAVEHMIRDGVQGMEFVCVNTHTQSRETINSSVPTFLRELPGVHLGSEPPSCNKWTRSIRSCSAEMLKGAHLAFIIAGMGGGTGTGVSPIVAEVARELGIRTVAVVTTPFAFDGKRVRRALEGLSNLGRSADALIVVSNEKLSKVILGDVILCEIFRCVDDAIKNVIVGIAKNIDMSGRADIDFDDVRTVTGAIGRAMADSGTGFGFGQVVDTEGNWTTFPLSEVVEIRGSGKVLSA